MNLSLSLVQLVFERRQGFFAFAGESCDRLNGFQQPIGDWWPPTKVSFMKSNWAKKKRGTNHLLSHKQILPMRGNIGSSTKLQKVFVFFFKLSRFITRGLITCTIGMDSTRLLQRNADHYASIKESLNFRVGHQHYDSFSPVWCGLVYNKKELQRSN